MFTKNGSLSTELSTGIPQKRSLFVIIVHFGAPEHTDRAVASAVQNSIVPEHIIVVDHAGTPYAPAIPVTIIQPKTNGGYAAGISTGLAATKKLGAMPSDLCMVINNDATLQQGSGEAALQWWHGNGKKNMLAGALYGYVSPWSGRAVLASKKPHAYFGGIPYMHGASLVGEYGMFSKIKMPIDLFLYWEDVAISMAVLQSGGTLAVIPGFHIEHDDHADVPSPQKLYYLVRNGAYVMERHPVLFWREYWRAVNMLRRIYHSLLSGNNHKTIVRALHDAYRGKLGKMPI